MHKAVKLSVLPTRVTVFGVCALSLNAMLARMRSIVMQQTCCGFIGFLIACFEWGLQFFPGKILKCNMALRSTSIGQHNCLA